MSRRLEVVIGPPGADPSAAPVIITESKPGDPPGVTGFLKINPAALGWLEILIGASIFGLVFWNYERMFLLPACFVVLVGVVTATAACTRNPCLVVTAQALNLLNIFSSFVVLIVFFIVFYVAFSLRVFLSVPMTSIDIAFVVMNLLAVVFSLIVFATSCCWCKSRKRLMVIHMSSGSPLLSDAVDQPCVAAPDAPQPSDAIDHPCSVSFPPAYSPVPSSEPPAYEEERRSVLSRASAPRWDKRRWIDELQQTREPLQV